MNQEDDIAKAITALREQELECSRSTNGSQHTIRISEYPVSAGWSMSTTRLLLQLPQSFPNGKSDMFWVDPDLTLSGGQVPEKANLIEEILGERWRRFSWHMTSWQPGFDSIHTFLAFIDHRLAQVC